VAGFGRQVCLSASRAKASAIRKLAAEGVTEIACGLGVGEPSVYRMLAAPS
jgi:hypothetical protein